MKDEALKLALEALEDVDGAEWWTRSKAITAIKQALAAPVQPVACKTLCELCVNRGYVFCANATKIIPIPTPLPAAPVQEPVAQYSDIVSDGGLDPRNKFDLPPTAQRWAVFCGGCRKEWSVPYQHPGKSICVECEAKCATTPPAAQRQWVGLDGFEQKELMAMPAREAVFAAEAKLKEKNT